jgi:hypothetical protein
MYIEDRLFSENTEEVLYSVTMTEDEYDLFSEFLEEREFGRVQEFKAAKKAFQSKARLEMAKKELKEMGSKPGDFSWNAVVNNPNNPNGARRLTARSNMWNGTYAEDKGLSKAGELNLRLTKKGESASSSWAGAHGTTLGNKYPMGKGYHRPK